MVWWLWVLLGLGLLCVEMATPGGLFALFFGLSAIMVGALTGFGWSGPAWMQWLLFSVLSVGDLALLRGPLRARLNLSGHRKPVDSLVGESGVVLAEVPGSGVGKVEIRGTSWNARSTAGTALGAGQRCRVERLDGLTLWVRPE